MYSYHNRIIQRIKNDELIGYEYVETYKNISPCLILRFSTEPYLRPIRKYKFELYEKYINI